MEEPQEGQTGGHVPGEDDAGEEPPPVWSDEEGGSDEVPARDER